MEIAALLGLLGHLSIAITLIVLGLLSRRLGAQTHAKPYFFGFFVAAVLILLSIAAQILDIFLHFSRTETDPTWVLITDGLPALAVTIGVIFAWRYWSWLLAERD
ncbi:MAG: hypothetical protein ABI835_04340 [Chloroflexota bacterium]